MKYTGSEKKVTARPRSKRLRETGTSVTTSTTIVNNNSTSETNTVTDPNSHTHANKTDLDKLGVDDDYVTITDKDVTEDGGDVASVTTKKAKAGYADEAAEATHAVSAHDIDDDSPLRDELDKKYLSKVSDDEAAGLIKFKKGIKAGDYKKGESGGMIDAEGNAEVDAVNARKGVVVNKSSTNILRTDDFLSGATGLSIWRDGNGRICGEVDKLTVRLKAIFNELEIRRLSYVGGNVILSPSGSVITKVEEVTETTTTNTDGVEDTTTTVTGYKCYFKTDDGTTATTNTWQKGDLAMCQTFNIKAGTYTNVADKYYWRLVIEDPGTTADGKQGYFVLGAGAGQYDTTSADIPQAGDIIVMRGNNIANSDRNSVIELITSGGEPRISLVTDITGFGSDKQTEIGRISPSETFFATKRFRLIGYDGIKRPVACDRGEWDSTAVYYFYDRVSYNGQLWLLDKIVDGATVKGEEPAADSTYWTLQVSKGDKGDPGNPGASVAAQYSPDGTTWHTPFVTGDVWMRTSTDGTTWSDAIRIVGENGDNGAYTNYMFAISAHATTSSSTTRPSDIYTWYDAPMAVTAEKPYLWAMVTYIDKNGNAVKTSYIRLTGEQGEQGASAVTLDLTNENDSVIAVGGSIVGTKEITTSARLWNGTYAVYDTGGLDFSSKLAATGCKVAFLYGTCDTYGGLYTFKIYDIDITASEIYADITAVYNNVEYTKRISISVLNGVDKYEIIPSVNAVSYNPTTGTRSTDAITFSIYRTGQTDGTRTEIAITDLPTGYGVYYMKSTATTTKGPLTAASVSISDMTSGNVVLSIKDSNNKVLDSETVPIVSDGKNGDPGSPGSPGTPGTNGITLVMTPDVLEFSTDTDGLVESTELSGDAAKKCVVTMNGSAPSSMEITAVSGCEAVVEGSDNDTIRITKVNTQDIDYTDADGDDATKTVSVSSGYVDFTAVLGTVSVNGRLRFTVSINVLWREIVSTDAEYNLVYTQLQTADGNISTLQKNVSTVTQTASKLTSKVTSVTETANGNKSDIASLKIKADQISLSVETQTNKSNLLTGTAFRRQEEFEWNNGSATNCMIVKNGGYGGTNSIYINSSSTTNGFCGIMFTGLALTISKTYMFSIMVKSPDITAFAGSAYCEVKFYKSDNTEISRVSIVLVPSASNTWETKKLSFTVPALTAYIDMPVFVVSSGQLYICRPMLQEGATYGGWSMSKQDYDYIGGNMLANSRTLTDPSGNSTVPYTETADLTQDGYGVCAVIHSCFSASTTAYKDALAWQDAIALEADTDYIFSAWVKGSGYIELYLYGGNGPISATENSDGVTYSQSDGYSYIKLTSEWRKVWVHWHTAGSLASAKYSLIAARQNYVSGSSNPSQTNASEDVYMACPKLETGATVTDYSESGEDMVSKAQLLATGIDIKAGIIKATTNKFIIQNNDGVQTASVNENGQLEVTDGIFSGTVKAKVFYHNVLNVPRPADASTPIEIGNADIVVFRYADWGTSTYNIKIPRPADVKGKVLTFINDALMNGTTNSPNIYITTYDDSPNDFYTLGSTSNEYITMSKNSVVRMVSSPVTNGGSAYEWMVYERTTIS